MTTGYDILLRSPELKCSKQVVDRLLEIGATDGYEVDWPGYPDRWEVVIPGLASVTDVMARHSGQAFVSDVESIYYGYDSEFTIDVEFRDDNQTTRNIVKYLSLGLAETFEVLVIFNYGFRTWKNDGPGEPLYVVSGWNDDFYVNSDMSLVGSSGDDFVASGSQPVRCPGEHAHVVWPDVNPIEDR